METKNFNLLRIAFKAGLSKDKIRKKDFSSANFSSANFRSADFSSADFSSANFRYADFSYADFSSADFRYADMSFLINETTFGLTINCPETGAFIGYKKAQGKLITLQILSDAKRSSATTFKCRCSKALVINIENDLKEISSDHDKNFIYRVGEVVQVDDFDECRWNECSTGIHFFMNQEMAKQYS